MMARQVLPSNTNVLDRSCGAAGRAPGLAPLDFGGVSLFVFKLPVSADLSSGGIGLAVKGVRGFV